MSLFCLTSCGKKVNGTKSIINPAFLSSESFGALNFECASLNGEKCPGGVARLFISDSATDSTEFCTGVLIAPDTVVTNEHCISDDKTCQKSRVAVLNGETYENASCVSVVRAHSDIDKGIKTIDYAILKLDRALVGPVMARAKEVPLPGEKLRVWVIDHLNWFDARLVELECQLLNTDGSMKLTSCPTITGNSGAPVLNSRNEVVGILWGSDTDDSIFEETPLVERRRADAISEATSIFKVVP